MSKRRIILYSCSFHIFHQQNAVRGHDYTTETIFYSLSTIQRALDRQRVQPVLLH